MDMVPSSSASRVGDFLTDPRLGVHPCCRKARDNLFSLNGGNNRPRLQGHKPDMRRVLPPSPPLPLCPPPAFRHPADQLHDDRCGNTGAKKRRGASRGGAGEESGGDTGNSMTLGSLNAALILSLVSHAFIKHAVIRGKKYMETARPSFTKHQDLLFLVWFCCRLLISFSKHRRWSTSCSRSKHYSRGNFDAIFSRRIQKGRRTRRTQS